MNVLKRNGSLEPVQFDKITLRLQRLSTDLKKEVNIFDLAKKTISGIYDGVSTTELDNLAAETAASMATIHPDYSKLASRIAVSSLHKNTSGCFHDTMLALHDNFHESTGEHIPLVNDILLDVAYDNKELIENAIDYDRDYNFEYFGLKTLEKSYLLKIGNKIVERPQDMFMRVAIGIHNHDIEEVLKTYELMSNGYFIHATPTLFNAGTLRQQMSSCFLLTMKDDSIDGIFETLKQVAKISQSAGGIGFSIHNIRSTGSRIKKTGGTSNGIVPMLKVFNDTARYIDQGGGKRKGSFAAYIEPWHADIFEFLELKKNHGKEEMRARDLFYALWIPDLFMKRVEEDGMWSLFSPDEAKGLSDVWGDDFEKLYIDYEKLGKARKVVKAQDLWFAIVNSQIETGTPYMLYKDAVNSKTNHQNIGTIKSSNLCTEIMEYTSPDEVAVCNLASIALPKFVENGKFDFDKLYDVTCQVTKNLNVIIDKNYYPVEEARNSNLRHRPIGIGVQGLADAFIMLRYPFDSEQARQLNKDIFETMYFAAMKTSMELAMEEGPYDTFKGSPVSKGIFQFDMWNMKPSERYDWISLKKEVMEHGVRNSLLLAPMPTASTSQILGNNECFEPYTSNIYTRRVLSGEFIVINKHLLNDLIELGLWNNDMKSRLISANGSIQDIDSIPQELKELYKTVWEIKQRSIIDMAADRGVFICQSQSMNLFIENPNISKLTSMHFYAWKKGLKTGMYYLRTKAAAQAVQFTINQINDDIMKQFESDSLSCSLEEGCLSCGA